MQNCVILSFLTLWGDTLGFVWLVICPKRLLFNTSDFIFMNVLFYTKMTIFAVEKELEIE